MGGLGAIRLDVWVLGEEEMGTYGERERVYELDTKNPHHPITASHEGHLFY